MTNQYDRIGTKFDPVTLLPPQQIEHSTAEPLIGDVTGQRCLDLACGTGRWMRILREHGAAQVLGIDISTAMIKGAKDALGHDSACELEVRDCSEPFLGRTSDGTEGGFDLIFAGWFFNYAPDEAALQRMWDNVYRNLTPGGRLIATVGGRHLDLSEPLDPRYRLTVKGIEKVPHGWRTELTAFTSDPPLKFQTWHLLDNGGELYEKCAKRAGLDCFKWEEPRLPDDDRRESGYWDEYLRRPHMNVVTAIRPRVRHDI